MLAKSGLTPHIPPLLESLQQIEQAEKYPPFQDSQELHLDLQPELEQVQTLGGSKLLELRRALTAPYSYSSAFCKLERLYMM
jgi:hypothetical protein